MSVFLSCKCSLAFHSPQLGASLFYTEAVCTTRTDLPQVIWPLVKFLLRWDIFQPFLTVETLET